VKDEHLANLAQVEERILEQPEQPGRKVKVLFVRRDRLISHRDEMVVSPGIGVELRTRDVHEYLPVTSVCEKHVALYMWEVDPGY
jgi:hypothetical protein